MLASQRARSLTYPCAGATRGGVAELVAPRGYVIDSNREYLGHGASKFAAARAALRAWEMFPRDWTDILDRPAPREGETVAVLVRAFGLWWLNAARILYVVDEPRRFCFAYGTLPGHAESGEERFCVEWDRRGEVWYELLAFSRPRYWPARLARPLTRALQRRFARASRAAMCAAVGKAR